MNGSSSVLIYIAATEGRIWPTEGYVGLVWASTIQRDFTLVFHLEFIQFIIPGSEKTEKLITETHIHRSKADRLCAYSLITCCSHPKNPCKDPSVGPAERFSWEAPSDQGMWSVVMDTYSLNLK